MQRSNQGSRSKGGRIDRNRGLPTAARKSLVQQANKQTDILGLCSDVPLVHSINDVELCLEHSTSSSADETVKTWLLDLTRESMKQLYVDAGWGWDDKGKGEELYHSSAQYLLVRNASTKNLVAFAHFRFDMDHGSHVLYCYELQVASECRGAGVGGWLMQLLHRIATESKMSKVVLTVGFNNSKAVKFYLDIGFHVDETSLSTLSNATNESYLILSCSSKPIDTSKMSTNQKKKLKMKRNKENAVGDADVSVEVKEAE